MTGKIVLSLLTYLFVPYYLRLLGAQAYGLVGFFVVLQTVFMLADGGLTSAYTREVARLSVSRAKTQQLLDLTITLERLLGLVGALIVLVIVSLSHTLAQHWFQSTTLTTESITNSVMLMGLIIGLQFPFLVHQGGLGGLQVHFRLNGLLVFIALIRGLGAIAILMFISKEVESFFCWQVFVSLIQLFCSRLLLLRSISNQNGATGTFKIRYVRPLWKFSLGIFGTTVTGMVLMQIDKLTLSKLLSLDTFTYYTLSGMLASIPLLAGQPINASVYPRLAQFVALGDTVGLAYFYHRVCQTVSVAVVPLGLTIAAFPETIMYYWTGDMQAAQNSSRVVTQLAIGYTLMALLLVPYSLQLAYSWTNLGFYLNIFAIVIIAPLLFILISEFGAVGASTVLLMVYGLQMILMIHFMHKRVIHCEKWRWYFDDIGKPFVIASAIVVAGKCLFQDSQTDGYMLVRIFMIWLAATAMTAISIRFIRIYLIGFISNFKQ